MSEVIKTYTLRDFEQFIPWTHGCGYFEAPCGCLYDVWRGRWCAVCPVLHGPL